MLRHTKRSYFFNRDINILIRILDIFVRDVYDDIAQMQPKVVDSLPEASEENRGRIVITQVAGIDVFNICRKNGSTYEWVTINVT